MTNPIYPVYIISKKRAESRLTAKALEAIRVPYRIVIEESDYKDYSAVIDKKKILVVEKDFRENPKYGIPDMNGQIGGSIPVRNWVWEHSISEGHKRHWILDDNIRAFWRLNRNVKLRVDSGLTFRLCEEFTDRYENVKMSGMNYAFFCASKYPYPPFYLNTRIYSCVLLDNSIDLRWRGKYNEDTDLSLRILKQNYCTILFNAFLCEKMASMIMKGGNTEDVYSKGNEESFDNRYIFAKSLYDQHPDVVKIIKKYGRFHHKVDYTVFESTPLKRKPEFEQLNLPKVDEHGMKLARIFKQ